MNILEVCSILQLLKKETVSFADIGSIIGISRQYVSKMKNEEIDNDKLLLIEKAYGVKIPNNFEIIEKTDDEPKKYKIQYWEGCDNFPQLKDDDFNEILLDYNFCTKKLRCNPEDLRIICMPGEEMYGGTYPLRNRDVLIIDTSITTITNSGVYFVTSHGGERVYVRRLLELLDGELIMLSTVDNPLYAKMIEKRWTKEMIEEANIQIIGRVIKNMSLKI